MSWVLPVSALAGPASAARADAAAPDHVVQFYESEDYLGRVVTEFIGDGLKAGEPAIIVATEAHRAAFCQRLEAAGIDLERARAGGQLTLADARETLARFMVDGEPDQGLFRAAVGGLFEAVRRSGHSGRVRAFGEMVALLCDDGNPRGAIRLEQLWNELERDHSFALLCGYALDAFGEARHGEYLQEICRTHRHVLPTEAYAELASAEARMLEVTLLQQRARALENEVAHRREAEEALRRSQAELVDFFENAVEGLHWVGPDGRILWANRADMALLGYDRDEYIGRHIAEFHVDREVIEDILVRLARNEVIADREARLRCKDGSIKHVLIHSNVLFRDGEFVHTRCFTRDITERKRMEDELRRTVRFAEMFVGILGHDLRNPLSAISTAAHHLQRRVADERIARTVGRIVSSSERMGRMIDQLLDFTRLRLGRGLPLTLERTDLAEICRVVLDELEDVRAMREIRMEVAGDLVGWWDADRLTQLVSNLLGNALGHGTPGEAVTVSLDGGAADRVRLEVANAGVIPPEVLSVVFEPFRSPSGDRKGAGSSGLGLGLFISQQIALAHGGMIEVRSPPEEGTRFIVTFPRRPPARSRESTSGSVFARNSAQPAPDSPGRR